MQRLEVRLLSVLFHKGHDGFLRGRPEPVLLCAAYALGPTARYLAKARIGLTVSEHYPSTNELDLRLLKVRFPAEVRQLALLCLALEEDAGSDIEPIALELDDAQAWSVRAADSTIAAPFTLSDLSVAHWAPPPRGQQVELAHRGSAIAERCTRDDWIGAGLLVLDAGRRTQACSPRIVSEHGRNDWELQLSITIR